MILSTSLNSTRYSFIDKLKAVDYFLIIIVSIIGSMSIFSIYSTESGNFSFYTKRLILAGIYSRVVLFFFNNNNQQDLEHLLDENLQRVAKIPELKSKIKIIKDYFPKAMKFVKNTI